MASTDPPTSKPSYQKLFGVLCAASTCLLLSAAVGHSQITLDGSLGPAGSLTGPNFVIPASVGQTRGSNLFHSFGAFNVLTGESATFAGQSAATNILSRVTGGQVSSINGKIASDIAGANLYLFNPAGVVFGTNASLDVKGSFHISTADYLKFADGAKFQASLARESVLTTAAVSAFGFLNLAPAGISYSGTTSSAMAVPQGQMLSIIGGNVDLTGGNLRAPAGRINIASVASPGEVVPNLPEVTPELNVDSFTTLGSINLRSTITTVSSAAGGGTIVIRGGRFMIDQAGAVAASTTGNIPGAPVAIDVRVRDRLTLDNNSQLVASATGGARSGDILVEAGTIEAQRLGRIVVSTSNTGNSGNMNIKADKLTVRDGGLLLSSTTRAGSGGNIEVQANDFSIANTNINGAFTGIAAEAANTATGKAGDVKINVGNLTITGGSRLGTDIHSTTFGAGPGGSVDIAANRIEMTGTNATGALFSTGIFASTFSSGNSGDLRITANSVKMTDHARAQAISVSTSSGIASGNVGSMTVIAAGDVELRDGSNFGASSVLGTGNAGNLNVTANNILISGIITSTDPVVNDFTGLTTATRTGSGSDLNVTASNVQIFNQGLITSTTNGLGNAGSVNLTLSGNLEVGRSGAVITGTTGSGDAGNLNLQIGGDLLITDRGFLTVSSQGSGAAGSISLNAKNVTISGTDTVNSIARTGVFAQAGSNASRSGDITISTGALNLFDGGSVDSATFGSARGGNIDITAGRILVAGINRNLEDALDRAGFNAGFAAANISSTAGSFRNIPTGSGGSIRLNAKEISIQDGGKILAGALATTSGKGGDIDLIAERINLNNNALISANSFGLGNAGNITVTARDFLRLDNSSITSRADFSDGGNIHMTVGKSVELINSQITTSVQGGAGAGGNITVDPQFVILNNSQITANAFRGPGGRVTIVADNFLASPDSSVTASSALSTPGTVDIQAPITDLSGSLAPLPESIVQATSLLRQSCATRYGSGKLSSLASPGRGGLPFEPGGFLTAAISQSAERSISQGPRDLAHPLIASTKPIFSVVSPCGKL